MIQKAILMIVLIILVASDLSFAQVPLPTASPLRQATTLPSVPWYDDPRWWAIIVSLILSLAGLFFQSKHRRADSRDKVAGDEFDSEFREPIREACAGLRSLAAAVVTIADIEDGAVRKVKAATVREETACAALTAFALALTEIDQRLGVKSALIFEINVELEDVFFQSLAMLAKSAVAQERRALAQKISRSIFRAIKDCDTRLREERTRFLRSRDAGRWRRWGRVSK